MLIGASNSTSSYYNRVTQLQKNMIRLATAQRINSASDDAAGLAISEGMRGQIRGYDQASRNTQDGMSMLNTAEGAMNSSGDVLQRMRELSVQAGNGTLTDSDRSSIQKEMEQLRKQLNQNASQTEFNGIKTNDGSLKAKLQTGANQGQNFDFTIDDTSSAALGADVDVSTQAGAMDAIESLDKAIAKLSSNRSSIGAMENRLDYSLNNNMNTAENIQAAESRIRDLDMSRELTLFNQNNVGMYAAMNALSKGMNMQSNSFSMLV